MADSDAENEVNYTFTRKDNRLNWKRVLDIDVERFLKGDGVIDMLDDLYQPLISSFVDPASHLSTKENVLHLFRVMQLLAELKHLDLQDQTDENKDLSAELNALKAENARRKESEDNYEVAANLKAEMDELKDLRHKLEAELTEKDGQVMQLRNQNKELQEITEKQKHDLLELDKLCSDLKEEIAAFRDQEMKMKTLRDSDAAKSQTIKQQIAQKNKQIDKYLKEINELSAAKTELESQIRTAQQTLVDVEEKCDRLAEEVRERKLLNQDADRRIDELESDKAMLMQTVASLEKRCQQAEQKMVAAIDQYSNEAHHLVETHEHELRDRDEKISRLKEELNNLREQMSSSVEHSSDVRIQQLDRALQEKSAELEQAYAQIKSGSFVVAHSTNTSLNSRAPSPSKPKRVAGREQSKEAAYLKVDLDIERKRIERLHGELAEKDERLTRLADRLAKFERGIYGMTDAQAEIRELERQLSFRDRDIAELTTRLNVQQADVEDVVEEMQQLRIKYGIPESEFKADSLKLRNQVEVERLRALKIHLEKEIERMDEERLYWKGVARDRAWESGGRAARLGMTADQISLLDSLSEAMRDGNVKAIKEFLQQAQKDTSEHHDRLAEEELRRLEQLAAGGPSAARSSEVEQLRSQLLSLEGENKALRSLIDERGVGAVSVDKNKPEQSARRPSATGSSRLSVSNSFANVSDSVADAPDSPSALKHELYRVTAELELVKRNNEDLRKTVRAIEMANDVIQVTSAESAPLAAMAQMRSPDRRQQHSFAVSQMTPSADLHEDVSMLKAKSAKEQEELTDLRRQLQLAETGFSDFKRTADVVVDDLKKQLTTATDSLDAALIKCTQFDEMCGLLEDADRNPDECKKRISELSRKITLLRVNENAMSKRFVHLNETAEQTTREYINYKHKSMEEMYNLREQLVLMEAHFHGSENRVALLEKQLTDMVPKQDHEECRIERDYLMRTQSNIAAKESELLEARAKIEVLEVDVRKLTQELDTTRTAYRGEKERADKYMAVMEKVSNSSGANTAGPSVASPQQVALIASFQVQVAQAQDNQHIAEDRLVRARKELADADTRVVELQSQIVKLSQQLRETAEREAVLEKKMTGCLSREESVSLQANIRRIEADLVSSQNDVIKLKQLAHVSSQMASELGSLRAQYEMEVVSLQATIRDLQRNSKTGDDSAAVLGKLQLQVLQLRKNEMELNRENERLRQEGKQQTSGIRKILQKFSDYCTQLFRARQSLREERRLRAKAEQDLRDACLVPLTSLSNPSHVLGGNASAVVASPSRRDKIISDRPVQASIRSQRWWIELENLRRDKSQLEQSLQRLRMDLDDSKKQWRDAEARADSNTLRREEADRLEQLISAHPEVREWIGKVAELSDQVVKVRLAELRLRRECEHFKDRCDYLSSIVDRSERALQEMEEKYVNMENSVEEEKAEMRRRLAEAEEKRLAADIKQSERDVVDYYQPDGDEAVTGITLSRALPLQRGPSESSALVIQTKFEDSQERLLKAELSITDLQARLEAKEREIILLKRRLTRASLNGDGPADGVDSLEDDWNEESQRLVRVAQMTIESLKTQLAKKEEAIGRYQEMLQMERQNNLAMREEMQARMEEFCERVHNESKDQVARMRAAAQAPAIGQFVSSDMSGAARGIPPEEVEEMLVERDKKLGGLQMELDTARKELQAARSMLDEKNKLVVDLEQRVKEAREDMPSRTLQRMVANLKGQVTEKDQQLKNLQTAVQQLRKDIVRVAEDEAKRSALQTRSLVSQLQQQQKSARGDSGNSTDRALAADVTNDLSSMQVRCENMKAEIARMKAERDKLVSSLQLAEEMSRKNAAEVSRLHDLQLASKHAFDVIVAERDDLARKLEDAAIQLSGLRGAPSAGSQNNDDELQRQYIQLKRELDAVRRERDEHRRRLVEVEEDKRKLSEDLAQQKKLAQPSTTLPVLADENVVVEDPPKSAASAGTSSRPTSARPTSTHVTPRASSATNMKSAPSETKEDQEKLIGRIRWEEEKKVQKQVDGLKAKLKEAAALLAVREKEKETVAKQLETVEKKASASTTEVERLRAELQRCAEVQVTVGSLLEASSVKSKMFELEQQLLKMQIENSALRTAAAYPADATVDLSDLRVTMEGQLLHLKLEKETLTLRVDKMKARVAELETINKMLCTSISPDGKGAAIVDSVKQALPNVGNPKLQKKPSSRTFDLAGGSSSSSSVEVRELQQVIVALQKVVEKLQTENDNLKQHSVSNLKYTEATTALKVHKQRVLDLEKALKETEEKAAQAARVAQHKSDERLTLAKVQDENTKLKKQIAMEKEQAKSASEKAAAAAASESLMQEKVAELEKALAEMKLKAGEQVHALEKELLRTRAMLVAAEDRLTAISSQTGAQSREDEALRTELESARSRVRALEEENAKLVEELDAFDENFFNEINLLKANYESAVSKLRHYGLG